jgi:hypothetical protein
MTVDLVNNMGASMVWIVPAAHAAFFANRGMALIRWSLASLRINLGQLMNSSIS